MFLIGCYTGLRWSDYGNLKEVNIKDGFIEKQVDKTDEYIKIPILPQVKEIMDRYPEGLPKISNQKVNEYIKVLCKSAGQNGNIEIVMHYGSKEKRFVYRKWEKVSTHTARRTFISLSVERGVRPEVVKKIT